MPYTDFHYTPTGTGVISGKEVLEQTEDAINDLGGQISGDVQTAIDTANNALNVASTASADAQNAVNTANTAYTTATNAQNTANAAQNTASNALTAAQNAQNDVNALGNRVTTAENNITQNTSDISGLTTRMGTAEGNITTLQNDVITAQGTATSAQNTATMARQQSYVFRYSSTALVASSTNSNTLLDNTDNLKVGDKVIDSNGVLFSVTAIDTANSTFTVGSALIDLALDSNVVHTSGVETVSGSKTFTWPIAITSYPCIRMYLSDDEWNVQPASAKQSEIRFSDKNAVLISYITFQHRTDANEPFRTCWRQQKMDGTSGYFSVNFNNLGEFYPENYNSIKLGKPNNRWLGVYAMNYYYGANDVEFSTKFVTTDTNQIISGAKTFSSTPVIYNSDANESTQNLYLRNQLVTKGDTSSSGNQIIRFADTNDKMLSRIQSAKVTNGNTTLNLRADTIDSNNVDVTAEVQIIAQKDGNKSFSPQLDNAIDLGRTSVKWRNILVNQINGLTPSSLSLPTDNTSNIIDISGYLTVLDGSQANTYQAPANGYIGITMSNCTAVQAYITGFWGSQLVRPTAGALRFFMPICKNMTVNILIFGGTVDNARFFPCQGNI